MNNKKILIVVLFLVATCLGCKNNSTTRLKSSTVAIHDEQSMASWQGNDPVSYSYEVNGQQFQAAETDREVVGSDVALARVCYDSDNPAQSRLVNMFTECGVY